METATVKVDTTSANRTPASPLILGANRNHTQAGLNWLQGANYGPAVLSEMQNLQSNWGSTQYPSGTFIYRLGHGITDGRDSYPGYQWEDYLGGKSKLYPYDDIQFPLAEAETMGATVSMVVNFGTGSPESAGRLAAYCNMATPPSGNPQRPSSHSSPYNVKYWEIGNEMSWHVEFGHDTLAPNEGTYAFNAAKYAKAIKDNSDAGVDPKVGFIAGTNANFMGDGWNNKDPDTMVKNILANSVIGGTQYCDALIFHGYPSYPMATNDAKPPATTMQRLATTTWVEKNRTKVVKAAINKYSLQPVDLWNTEFSSLANGTTDKSYFGAVYGIDGQMHAVRNGYPIAVPFCMWHYTGSGIWNADNVLFPNGNPTQQTAWYTWMKIWAKHWGSATCPAFSPDSKEVEVKGVALAKDATADVSMQKIAMCSSISSDGTKLYVMVLNRTEDTDIMVTVAPDPSWTPSGSVATSYYQMTCTNSTTWDGAYSDFNASTVGTALSQAAGNLDFSVPARSVNLFIITGSAGTPPSQGTPTVSSLSVTHGYPGQSVTLTGTHFDANPDLNTVTFPGAAGDVVAQVTAASTTSLTVIVPSGAQTGAIKVTVGSLYGTSSTFTVDATPQTPAPTISSFTPTSAYPGQAVTLTGTNFDPSVANDNVKFYNNVPAQITAASATSLTVLVPAGAATGPITLVVGSQSCTSPTSLTVTTRPAPTVSGLSASSGYPGQSLTLTGTNFDPNPANNQVKFYNNVTASITAASATSLVVTVPAGAATGVITVTVGGQSASSGSFTVTTAPVTQLGSALPVRQTVLAGAVGADGRPNFLSAGSGLAVSLLGAQTPVSLAFAAGSGLQGPQDFVATIASDTAIAYTLPASTTSYLYVDQDPSSGSLTSGYAALPPVYSATAPASPAVGQHWYDLVTGVMYACTALSGGGSSYVTVSTATGALSGGDASGHPASNAFDGNGTSYWASAQTGSGIFNAAYLGNNFGGTSYTISNVAYIQSAYPARITDFYFQVSDTGNVGDWTTVQGFTSQTTTGSLVNLPIAPGNQMAGKYARLLAHASTGTGASWQLIDLEFQITVIAPPTAVWTPVRRVFVGEATTDASAVALVTTYAMQGRYLTGRIALDGDDQLAIAHNLGTEEAIFRIGLAGAPGAALVTGLAASPTLDRLSLGCGIPVGQVEADVVVTRAF